MSINKTYYNELKRFKQLTDDEVNQLSLKIKSGDTQALNVLTESNLKLVIFFAKQYFTEVDKYNIIELDDLIAEGNIGLIISCKKYKPNSGIKFSYYASFWIKKYISDYILNNQSEIRLPLSKFNSDKQIHKIITDLQQQYERPVTQNDIEELNLFTEGEIFNYFNQNKIKSINENDYNIEDRVDDAIEYQIEMKDKIRKCLNKLNPQEQIVIKMFFGIDCSKTTGRLIGVELNVTKQRINEIKSKALKKLAKWL